MALLRRGALGRTAKGPCADRYDRGRKEDLMQELMDKFWMDGVSRVLCTKEQTWAGVVPTVLYTRSRVIALCVPAGHRTHVGCSSLGVSSKYWSFVMNGTTNTLQNLSGARHRVVLHSTESVALFEQSWEDWLDILSHEKWLTCTTIQVSHV